MPDLFGGMDSSRDLLPVKMTSDKAERWLPIG